MILSDGFADGVGMKLSQFNVDTFSNKSHVHNRLLYNFRVERLVSPTQFNSRLCLRRHLWLSSIAPGLGTWSYALHARREFIMHNNSEKWKALLWPLRLRNKIERRVSSCDKSNYSLSSGNPHRVELQIFQLYFSSELSGRLEGNTYPQDVTFTVATITSN